VVYAASIRSCRPCLLREQCQWQGRATAKSRQVSVLLHPLLVGDEPLRLRVTGVVVFIDVCACNSFAINASRSSWDRGMLPLQPSLPHRFLVPNVPIIVSAGQNGWLAMRVLQQRVR
jgi:hypothetical protein